MDDHHDHQAHFNRVFSKTTHPFTAFTFSYVHPSGVPIDNSGSGTKSIFATPPNKERWFMGRKTFYCAYIV